MTQTLEAPAPTGSGVADLIHYTCCDETQALCGARTHDDVADCDADCVVCIDIEKQELPCGAPGCPFEGGR